MEGPDNFYLDTLVLQKSSFVAHNKDGHRHGSLVGLSSRGGASEPAQHTERPPDASVPSVFVDAGKPSNDNPCLSLTELLLSVPVDIDRRRNIDAAVVLAAELPPFQLIAALFVSPILRDVASAADLSRFCTAPNGARSASLPCS